MSDNEMISGAPGEGLPLLPSNATAFEKANSQVAARLFDLDVGVIEQSRDPAVCDAAFTPFLAWERSIHFWAPGDDTGNRARIESSFNDHLNYGSPQALEAEIAMDTGQTVQIKEFFEAGLAWPYFAVDTIIAPGDPEPDIDALMASAMTRKNVRDMPKPRIVSAQAAAGFNVACAVYVTTRISAVPPKPPPNFYVAAAMRAVSIVSIAPLHP